MNKQLAVFTIGPVQSFIAAARKLEDLWSGSYLLSYLVDSVLKKINADYKEETACIFPVEIEPEKREDIASLPNRLTLEIEGSEDRAAEILQDLEQTVKETFKHFCLQRIDDVFDAKNGDDLAELKRQAEGQIETFLEVYWATADLVGQPFTEAKKEVEAAIGAIKNDKRFEAVHDDGLVCTVCHQRAALSGSPANPEDQYKELKEKLTTTWQHRKSSYKSRQRDDYEQEDNGRIRDNEYLCGICLAKRTARDHFRELHKHSQDSRAFQTFPSVLDIGGKEPDYYGILLMDGDNMGDWFSKGDTPVDYRNTSGKLAVYAGDFVRTIVKEKYKGKLVYAGGDDVLAFLPVKEALLAADELRQAFSSKEVLGPEATSSAGLVIAYKKAPLQSLLDDVRQMETKAKGSRYLGQAKNALAIRVRTHSGEMLEKVLPWIIPTETENIRTVNLLKNMIAFLDEKSLSKSFIYQLMDTFKPLLSLAPEVVDADLFFTELIRLADRSVLETARREEIIRLVRSLRPLYENSCKTVKQFIYLLKMAAFFNKKGEVIGDGRLARQTC